MGPGDEAFVRRIAALLVAEHGPAATPPRDADADGLARALAVLREASGDADRLASNALVAGFDRPPMAVAAAGRLHAVAPRAWRVGIHVAEVFMRADDEETRPAIARATALARLARPGTSAVATAALAAIGPVRDATLEALESAPGQDSIHLMVPHATGPSIGRRRLVTVLAGTALGGAAAVAWIARARLLTGGDARLVTLGVGSFHSSRVDPEHAWIGDAIRMSLNTQLSELSGVKVYSQSFLDFLMSREGLSEIEVATRLGIEKMLSGRVLVVGDSLRVEAQVTDVASGVLEGAYAAVGREEDFLALENELVMGVISKLSLQLSPEDERRLAARRTADPDALRRFLDTEGAEPSQSVPPGTSQPQKPSSHRFSPLAPRAAWADDATAEVVALVEDYRKALEAHDVAALAAMYLTFVPEQRALLERYFASVRDLAVRLLDVDVAVVGEEAVVSYTRVDDFIDIPTRRPQHMSVRVTRTLRRVDGKWRLAPGK